MKRTTLPQRAPATDTISYAGYRFPPDVISYAVWLYYRFPLSLRMVEELLAARGIDLTYETVRRWSVKFGLSIARRIRSTALARGDKWQVFDVEPQIPVRRRVAPELVSDKYTRRAPMFLEQLAHQAPGRVPVAPALHQHCQHKGLNNRGGNSHQPTRVREKVMRRFKSACHLQRFASVHDQVGNLFMHCGYHTDAKQKRALRTLAFEARESVTGAPMLERLAA
jgi:putative transposase